MKKKQDAQQKNSTPEGTTKDSPEFLGPTPITDKVAGMFSKDYSGQDYKELLEAAILERNL